MVIFKKINDSTGYAVSTKNGIFLGQLMPGDDGYHIFFSEDTRGAAWSGWLLREIADKIDELDKDWNEQVIKALENVPKDVI